MTTIPKPAFPSPRPRRSSISQAAAANSGAADPTETAATEEAVQPEQEAAVPAAVTPAGLADSAQAPGSPDVPPAEGSASGTNQRRKQQKQKPSNGDKRPSSATAAKRPVASKDILLSLPEDAKDRMVNTIKWTQPHTGIGQQSKFIRRAITELCERLEREFNNGQVFPTPAVADDD